MKKNGCEVECNRFTVEYYCVKESRCNYKLDGELCGFYDNQFCKNIEAQLKALDALEQKVKAEFIRLRNEREKADDN